MYIKWIADKVFSSVVAFSTVGLVILLFSIFCVPALLIVLLSKEKYLNFIQKKITHILSRNKHFIQEAHVLLLVPWYLVYLSRSFLQVDKQSSPITNKNRIPERIILRNCFLLVLLRLAAISCHAFAFVILLRNCTQFVSHISGFKFTNWISWNSSIIFFKIAVKIWKTTLANVYVLLRAKLK